MNTSRSRLLLWVCLGIAVVLAMLWQWLPLPDARGRLSALPASGWRISSRDLPLTDTERSVFGRARVLKRLYQVSGQRVVLIAMDGSQERHAIHDPLYCFRGAGWKVRQSHLLPVPSGNARHLALSKRTVSAEALSWISNGTARHPSPFRYWMQATARRLSLGKSGEEPVLILLQPATGEAVDWTRLLSEFPDLFRL
ncbi:MAG: hypothetical protein RIS76_1922 [Verrucomicrobiota bacterium]|jgi:hypothetical protein